MLLEKLTDLEKQAALNEVGYTEKQLETDLNQIKNWLKEQNHLPPSRLKETDSFFKRYLTNCKGSLEKVKKKLDAYYTIRNHSEIFDCRDPIAMDYLTVQEMFYVAPVPKLFTKKLTRIAICKLSENLNQERFDLLNFGRILMNLSELVIRVDELNIKTCIVMDSERISVAKHFARIRPIVARDMISLAQDVLPTRLSNILFINTHPLVATAVNNLIMPFLSKKLKERVHITAEGYKSLWKYLDKTVLPSDYGGELPSVKYICGLWRDEAEKKRSWYINELSERTDETKRVHQEDTMNNPYFGVHGSLRQLVID